MKKMKFLCIAIAAIFMSQTSFAQINIGAKFSPQWSNVNIDQDLGAITDNIKTLSSYGFGIVIEKEITDAFSIQPEITYNTTGFKLNLSTAGDLFGIPLVAGAEVENKYKAIEVPLLAKYKIGSDMFKGYIVAGPTFSYAFDGKVATTGSVLGLPIDLGEVDVDLDAINYEKFEVGGTAGIGGIVDLDMVQIFADFRYGLGFTKVVDIPLLNEKISNKKYGFNIGVMFTL